MFAVIESNGNQLKVLEGKQYKIDLIGEIKENEEIKFSDVLLIDDGKEVLIGSPKIEGAQVLAKSLGIVREKKVEVNKFHSKKRYSRTAGERPEKLLIEIVKISAKTAQTEKKATAKAAPKKVSTVKKDEK